jgi:uncharacterized protein
MLASQRSPLAHEVPRPDARKRAAATLALAYGGLGALAVIVATALGRDPLAVAPWLPLGSLLDGWAAHFVSVALGLMVAAGTIAATRAIVPRVAWAKALHDDLRPVVHGADDASLLLTAVASGLGEELFFRGLLVPLVGMWISSVGFGLLHQVRGRARWAWAAWAAIMGFVFALLFELTGSLLGPILAHVIINTANLRYIRDRAPEPKPRALGGLLER